MKTKDFIKLLQKEDPTGETHVRLPGGTPKWVESKPGYYDGPYSYIDEDGNYVLSDKGSKIDVHCSDIEDFIWEESGDTSKVILDVHNPEKYKGSIEKYSKEARECIEDLTRKMGEETIDMINKGWKIVRKIEEGKFFNQHWYIRNPKKFKDKDKKGVFISNTNQKTMVCGHIRFVRESGKFYQVKDEKLGLIFYELKE